VQCARSDAAFNAPWINSLALPQHSTALHCLNTAQPCTVSTKHSLALPQHSTALHCLNTAHTKVQSRAEQETSVLDVSRGLCRTHGQAEKSVCVCTGSSRKRYLCAGCEQRFKQNSRTGSSRTQSVCVYRVEQKTISLCWM
jgi:hypothetical protein